MLRNADEATWTDSDPALTEDRAFDRSCGDACLVFTSAPLDQDVRLSGQPTVHLWATSDDVSTHLVPAARLTSAAPASGRGRPASTLAAT